MELIFEIRDAEEGGFSARALGHSIFTEAETWDELRANMLEAVSVHFEEAMVRPRLVQMLRQRRIDSRGSCMKLPRGVSADRLIRALQHVGYSVIRQRGSHFRLNNPGPPSDTITVPLHNPLKTGTLHGILAEVALGDPSQSSLSPNCSHAA
jgi:predicted RNA binding protein YcfA (HicA-like mRNA interferase family)